MPNPKSKSQKTIIEKICTKSSIRVTATQRTSSFPLERDGDCTLALHLMHNTPSLNRSDQVIGWLMGRRLGNKWERRSDEEDSRLGISQKLTKRHYSLPGRATEPGSNVAEY
ncbi:hypothetical protein CVT26_008127 [Gymnopilus dilepis]|uniref:Uncharacterized protein n=1 Tax=Gymnopilus dilepis TaxID=231916 RepID=A0A409YJU1_9AGAR|nr:hypothetical protein CVT26_008127 [Gymnopilus dilepis]